MRGQSFSVSVPERAFGLLVGLGVVMSMAFCLAISGYSASETPKDAPLEQGDNFGLTLRVLRLPTTMKKAHIVKYVEQLHNTSAHPVWFAPRRCNRQLLQVAKYRMVHGERKLVYNDEPIDVSGNNGYDYEYLVDEDGNESSKRIRIVKDFSRGFGAADGGEVIDPSEIQIKSAEKFTILIDGLYRLQSEWSVDILDPPGYKVKGECKMQSNVLDLYIEDSEAPMISEIDFAATKVDLAWLLKELGGWGYKSVKVVRFRKDLFDHNALAELRAKFPKIEFIETETPPAEPQ